MKRISLRRVSLLLAPPLLALGAIVVLGSPPGVAGSTLCFPVLGPRTHIDTTATARERMLASAHEHAHAAQCREQGALRNYLSRVSRSGRLDAELGAYCAEGRVELAVQPRADYVVERILDELEEGYPWFRGTSRAEFAARLATVCPDLIARARDVSRRGH
jgi:hypothetical protein